MKHNILKSLFISTLLLMGITNAWAYNFGDNYGNSQVTIWFDNSATQLSNIKIHFWQDNSAYNVDWDFTHISGTDYWYINTNYANFKGFKIHGTPKNSTDNWGWETNERHDEVHSGWYARCISPKSTDKNSDIEWTVPGLQNVTLTNTTAAANVLSGVGTNSNPYIVKPATNITVKLTGDLIDSQCSKLYKFGTSQASATQTYTVTPSAVAGTAYDIEGFTGAKRDTYTSRYASAGVLYFKTAYNISASVNGGHGIVDITNGGEYVYQGNTTFQLTATPEVGYEVDTWTITGGTKTGTGNTITVEATNNSDVTAVVTFKISTYTITYHNLEGGSNHANNPSSYTIETPTITLGSPTKELYTFEGWYQQADFSGDKVTQITQGTTGNIDLYAKWSETKYSVNIYTNNSHYGITTPSGANWVGPTPVEITATPHNGYHFTEWTATGGATIANTTSATTFVTATSIGTVIAHFVESLYDITVQASNNAHGKVTQSATEAGISTAITITADPMEGYEFTGWSKDGDITIASINSATTTLTATSEGSVTANFAPKGSTPIYFRANHIWKRDNARYAVYYWEGTEEGWDDVEEIGSCSGDYYKAKIPQGYTNYKFVRLDPTKPENNWNNKWTETDDISLSNNGETFYNMNKIYFRPNGEWKNDNARFAAYFYLSGQGDKWMSMLPSETEDGLYWCDFPTQNDGGETLYFDHIIFCRMNPATKTNNWDNRWNQTDNLALTNYNYFITADKITDGGSWSIHLEKPTYDVTLYSCSFGEYGFIYNNVEYTSPESGNITYQIPINATVKVFSRPYSKEYRGDVMVKQGEDTRWEITPDNPLLNITCNTILDDNYKTTGEHEVYLAVPHDGGSTTWWYQMANHTNYLYAFHDRTETGQGYSVKMEEVGTATINSKLHTYYRCVIPAEVNTIRFEKRSNATTTVLSTIDLRYDIPLNSVNCYRLDRSVDNKKAGIWEQAPGFGGDFRLVHHRAAGITYPSDIIRYGTISQIVSLHIYPIEANSKYPKLELQQQNAEGEWVPVSGQDKLVKDINRIMNDKQDKGCGVWNFTVTTDGGDHATVNFNTPQRYTGNYYIRTNNAEGEWRNYTLSTNLMTFSSYAKNHSGYTHYFCRYIDIKDGTSSVPGHSNNVKFIIANDYCSVLSNEMAGDSHTATGGLLPESANVRWTWNEVTNEVSRAYILGSHGSYDHIVANGNRLNDQEDWIYEIDIEGVTRGTLLDITATYPSKTINGVTPTTQTFANDLEMIHTDAGNSNQYTIRVMYDFKINKTLIMLLPDQADPANIGVDVLIDRTDQGEATQVQSTVTSNEGYTVYSTLTLTKDHLLGNGTEWERLYYWISFPFDVRISEIFGFGEYGKHYIIQYYDGAARAENGCWADSPTYWRQIQITDTTYSARRENEDEYGNPQNGILVANKGYVLALARNIANSNIFKHGNEYVRLYFPSREKIKSIDGNMQNTTVYLRPHTCTIEREDRNIYDSNWHIIGVPSYADKTQTLAQDNLLYFYTYNTADNTYAPTSAQGATVQFNSMHAYMVQFAGNINWQSWTLTQEPQSVVARRQSAEAQENYSLRLELQRDGQYADQTFIQLQAEGATTDYDINQDLTKIINTGANIYTLAGEKHIQLAGNVLPSAKTTIPVGVQVAQAGTYTFALPDGTSGISATLVDNLSGIHTNLLLDGYTVTLDAGATEGRFYIVLDPERTATAVENIDGETNEAQKYLIDGQLIIKHDGIKYNVQGEKL